MTTIPLPLRDYPKGLTVVPMHHAAAFTAALSAAAVYAEQNGAALDERVAAHLLRVLYQTHIAPMDAQLKAAQAEASGTAVELEHARAQLAQHAGDAEAASVRRAVQAERRDKKLRELVRSRDGDNCRYCAAELTPAGRGSAAGVLDHIEPGIACGASNLVMACCACHRRKSKHNPGQAGMSLLPVPETPRLTEPGPPRKDTMYTDAATADDTAEDLEIAYTPEIRLAVSYRNGQHSSVSWSAGMIEPTPDELCEMLRQLAPAEVPQAITVTLASGHDALGAALNGFIQRRANMAPTAEAVLSQDSVIGSCEGTGEQAATGESTAGAGDPAAATAERASGGEAQA